MKSLLHDYERVQIINQNNVVWTKEMNVTLIRPRLCQYGYFVTNEYKPMLKVSRLYVIIPNPLSTIIGDDLR